MPTKKPTPRRAAKTAKSARPAKVQSIRLRLPPTPGDRYEVVVGTGLVRGRTPALVSALADRSAALVCVDHHLGPAAVEPVLKLLEALGIRWGVAVVKAHELEKSMSAVEALLEQAASLRLERGDALVAIGGGVVGDVAGFAAAAYRRGVSVIQCPSTLLAMVDASVGGKTGVNLLVRSGSEPGDAQARGQPRLLKNMAGAFHQPALVVADVSLLGTLPPRELRCGLAECLKHGLLAGGAGDAKLWSWTLARLPKILALDPATTVELVRRNVAVKARVVGGDPFERSTSADGGRMALNLGHTFAHAIETLPGLSWPAGPRLEFGPLKHGEAVGLGLLAAARVAVATKLAPASLEAELVGALSTSGLPTKVAGLPGAEAIIDRMLDDKKTAGRKLRLILPTKGFKVRVVDAPPPAAVRQAIDSLRA